jgi:hypothetical protein
MNIDKNIVINAFFQDDAFEQTWMDIMQEYQNLGFRDQITDEEMIAEFKYIAQQLRKYKFSKQDQIVNHDTMEEMLAEVEELIGKAPEYGNTRKDIVYNFLRDHWLIAMYNVFQQALNMNEEDEDA